MHLPTSRRVFLKRLALTMVWGIGFSTPRAVAEERRYVLATAAVGGTFYPVGSALATLVRVRLRPTQKTDMTVISSAGSGENVRLLRENKAQFALMAGLVGHYAWTGQGPFVTDGPQTNLRSVATLGQEANHFLVRREYAKTGTIEDMRDLRGKKVSLGLKGSGALESNRFILSNFGIDIERDLQLVYLNLDESARALQAGWIDAMSVEAGVPVSAITLALNALDKDLVILEFTDMQMKQADGGLGLWIRYVIKAGTYPAQDKDIHTIAAPTFLAVRADVDEETVYQITKMIFENLPFLQAIHKALLDTSLDKALTGLSIPLHPGALRYYREVELDVPARLIVD